jgi:hypothetical protein
MPEDARFAIFDAVAFGLTYYYFQGGVTERAARVGQQAP